MCTFPTAPPPLAFFWPGQTKYWLGIGLFFAWYVASFLLNSRGRLFRPVPGRPRELAVRCFFAGYTLALAGVALACAVALPSWDAIIAWRTTQLPWATTYECVHDLDATVSHLSSSSRTLGNLSAGVAVVGFFIMFAGPFAVTSFQRIRRGEGMPRQRPRWMERPWIDVMLGSGITGLAAALTAAAVQARWVTIPLVLIASCVHAAFLVRLWIGGPLRRARPRDLAEQRLASGIFGLVASVATGGGICLYVVQLGLTIANPRAFASMLGEECMRGLRLRLSTAWPLLCSHGYSWPSSSLSGCCSIGRAQTPMRSCLPCRDSTARTFGTRNRWAGRAH